MKIVLSIGSCWGITRDRRKYKQISKMVYNHSVRKKLNINISYRMNSCNNELKHIKALHSYIK